MISYDQIRAEYRAKYRAYKLELIDDLKAQRDKLNFTFSDLLKSKRDWVLCYDGYLTHLSNSAHYGRFFRFKIRTP